MFGLNRLSIQSKMILLLLAVSLGSIAVMAFIGYESARAALSRSVEDHLQGVRVAKTTTLKAMLENLRDDVISISDSRIVIDGMRAFRGGYRELGQQRLTESQASALKQFYAEDFVPKLAKHLDAEPVLEQYLPTRPAEAYLQYHYIAANPAEYEKKQALLQAPGDHSRYGDTHARLHKPFSRAVELFGFEDLMLVDADTLDVVYTYEKASEFGTNLETGPYANTQLAARIKAMRGARDRDDFRMVDFEAYRPNLGRPMGFALSPIFDGAELLGILVLQVPIEEFNRVLTGDFNWQAESMGKTGESFVVAPDRTMRSHSRFMYEDPPALLAALNGAGVAAKTVNQIARQGSAMNVLPVTGETVDLAFKGRSGIGVVTGYRGEPVLSAYGPVELESLHWAVMTQMDKAEAEAPIRELARKVVIASCAGALLVSLLALLSAQVLTRPLRVLADGARRLGAGETGVKVNVPSRDEFGQLAGVFNDMSANIKTQTERLESQRQENQELLLNLLPATAVAQRQAGDGAAQSQFKDVSVLCATVVNMETLATGLDDTAALARLSELVSAFDEAAERCGVERIKADGGAYLAACGLSVNLPDHARRVVNFALEMTRIVARFNREQHVGLELAIGINTGPLVGGVIGRRKFRYELWGETVNVALALANQHPEGIRITAGVRERLGDENAFTAAGRLERPSKATLEFWQLSA